MLRPVLAALRAILSGIATATIMLAVPGLPLILSGFDDGRWLGIVVIEVFVAALIVPIAFVLVGLPATWLLRRSGNEHRFAYALLGGAAGMLLMGGGAFALFGTASGFVTGLVWGAWREQAGAGGSA